jgi:hypothetical protein
MWLKFADRYGVDVFLACMRAVRRCVTSTSASTRTLPSADALSVKQLQPRHI